MIFKNKCESVWACWPIPVISLLKRQRQKDQKFMASLGYKAILGYMRP